jgi:uncharacterized lipoprotein NlpE involved in copper resistance
MKTKVIAIIALLIIGMSLLGCNNPTPKNNLPSGDETDLMNEIDSTWVDDSELGGEDMLPNDEEVAASEATNNWIDENETVDAGEMI